VGRAFPRPGRTQGSPDPNRETWPTRSCGCSGRLRAQAVETVLKGRPPTPSRDRPTDRNVPGELDGRPAQQSGGGRPARLRVEVALPHLVLHHPDPGLLHGSSVSGQPLGARTEPRRPGDAGDATMAEGEEMAGGDEPPLRWSAMTESSLGREASRSRVTRGSPSPTHPRRASLWSPAATRRIPSTWFRVRTFT